VSEHDEMARVVAVGRRDGGMCPVIAVRLRNGSVLLFPHGVAEFQVWLPAEEWDKLVGLPRRAP